MAAGRTVPAEVATYSDPVTGRTVRRWTGGGGHAYHLYYQAYPISRDGRWLVFCSERDATVQLYRLDRHDGTITQLTDGRGEKVGWWPWTAMDFTGVHGFIACLNRVTDEVYYHDRDEVRSVHLDTLEDRLLTKGPPGCRPFSQMACSWDGRYVATVWTSQADADRCEASHAEARDRGSPIQKAELYWRNVMRCRLDAIDTTTGDVTTLVDLPAPVHNMAITADDQAILAVTAPDDHGGFLRVDRDHPGQWSVVEPPPGLGRFCHYHAGANGRVSFEATVLDADRELVGTHIGQADADGSNPRTWRLDHCGYCHVGHDPDGRFLFAAVDNGNTACGHHLAAIEPRPDGTAGLRRLTADLPSGSDQRWHAHPVLTPDRRGIVYTALGDDALCHVYEVDVADVDTDNVA